MKKLLMNNFAYIFWFLTYYLLFSLLFGASSASFFIVSVIYVGCIALACTSAGESLLRGVMNVRPLETGQEIDYLYPIFGEVYQNAWRVDNEIFSGITLYVQDTFDINAFAMGRKTLVVTKGAVQLLSRECLYGIMAHELGHFSNYDTVALLISSVGNMFLTIITRILSGLVSGLEFFMGSEEKSFIVKIIRGIIAGVYKSLYFIGDIILMASSRESEYKADYFAYLCGYKNNLLSALYELNMIAYYEPKRLTELLRSTHPTLTSRIGYLESYY